jgi:sec-independent protein translocase protein TatB
MFDFDAGKILIVGIVALIFIPPKDLPRVLRQVGQFVGKMKRMAGEFQGQFMDAMREADMADLRREAQKLADSAKVDVGLSTMSDLKRDIEAKPVMRPLAPPALEASSPAALPASEHDAAPSMAHSPEGEASAPHVPAPHSV